MIVKMKKAKDFENLWFRYKTEGEPKNISINQFCMQNGVQFTQFNKWFRSTRQDVIPVIIEGTPEEQVQEASQTASVTEQPELKHGRSNEIMVIIKTRSGLNIQQRNLDYQGLKKLVERLEGLC